MVKWLRNNVSGWKVLLNDSHLPEKLILYIFASFCISLLIKKSSWVCSVTTSSNEGRQSVCVRRCSSTRHECETAYYSRNALFGFSYYQFNELHTLSQRQVGPVRLTVCSLWLRPWSVFLWAASLPSWESQNVTEWVLHQSAMWQTTQSRCCLIHGWIAGPRAESSSSSPVWTNYWSSAAVFQPTTPENSASPVSDAKELQKCLKQPQLSQTKRDAQWPQRDPKYIKRHKTTTKRCKTRKNDAKWPQGHGTST